MTPAFSLSVGGSDITALVADRLVSITVVDEAGFESDRLSLTLDNRDLRIAPPAKGRMLELSLGYQDAQQRIGTFVADEVESEFSAEGRRLRIKAKAADMTAGLKEERIQSWGLQPIGAIVGEIAARHGLRPVVGAGLADVVPVTAPYGSIEQIREPDMDFLSRLAEQLDAVAKPASGTYLFVSRGDARAANGRPLTSHALPEADVSGYAASAPDRPKFASVEASYIDVPFEGTRTAIVGAGNGPVHRMNRIFGSEDAATRAAEDRRRVLQRNEASLRIDMPGRADIFAEDALVFQTPDPLAAGRWVVERVEHRLARTFRTTLTCGVPNA